MRVPLHRRLWKALTRERRWPSRKHARVHGRSNRTGVALLLVMSIIVLMTILVTELSYQATLRFKLAAAQRDEAMAEGLARGGVEFYRLILIANKQFENSAFGAYIEMAGQYLGINAGSLWQIVPSINTSLLRTLFVVDGDSKKAEAIAAKGGLTDQQQADSRAASSSLKKAFLDFPGDFTVKVVDENKQIYVGDLNAGNMAEMMTDPQIGILVGLMQSQAESDFLREQNIEKWELIGNLVDWTDRDNIRIYQGGNEDSLYQKGPEENRYLPKNGPLDTLEEIRLIDLWNRDDVWQHYGRFLTIYGNGRINVNTAPPRVLEALLMRYINPQPTNVDYLLSVINTFRTTPVAMGGGYFRSPDQFVSLITQISPGQVDPRLQQLVSTTSTVFRVTSTATVGDSTVKVEAVFDFNRSRVGKVVYWGIQ